MVKALVEKGATFDFLLTEEIAIKYNCYVSQGDSHINYSRYLLKIPKEGIMEAFGFRGMTLEQSIEQDSGEVLSVLSDTERVAVLQFLFGTERKNWRSNRKIFSTMQFFSRTQPSIKR